MTCVVNGVIDSVNATGRAYGTTYMYQRRPDCTSQADTIVPTITFAPLAAMGDYVGPVRRGFVKADEDGNVWILPATSAQAKGGLLYDAAGADASFEVDTINATLSELDGSDDAILQSIPRAIQCVRMWRAVRDTGHDSKRADCDA